MFKPVSQFMRPSPDSTTLPTVGLATPSITPLATQRARLLLGCYRKGDAEDPEIYVAAIAAMLSKYPEDIAVSVTDPRTGIAGRSKFLPTLSEVRDFCEFAMRPRREAQLHEAEARRIQAQLDERRRIDEAQKALDVERINRVHEKYKRDKAAGDVGRFDTRPKITGEMTREEAEAKLAKYEPIGPEHAADLKRLFGFVDRCIDASGAK